MWVRDVAISLERSFAFEPVRDICRKRLTDIGLIPLQLYLGKPYLQSALNILSIVVYFLPLGVLFSALVTRHLSGSGARATMTLLFLIITGLLAGIIEFGQVFIPARYPDTTDWICMVAGAMRGYTASNLQFKKATQKL